MARILLENSMFRSAAATILSAEVLIIAIAFAPEAGADNTRLNDGVVANVYTLQHQAGCSRL